MALRTGQAAARAALCALTIAACTAMGCTKPATQLVVTVDTDLAVPEEVATVVVRLRRTSGQLIEERTVVVASASELPLSFGVVPPEGDAETTVLVEAEAQDAAGAVVVVVAARTGFVAERSLLLRMLLQRSCRSAVCGEAETCIDGVCESDRVDPTTLPPITPGAERDAGRADGGLSVDGGSDAGSPDAAVCAAPGSCDCPPNESCAAVCRAGEVCVVVARRAASFALRCESGSRCTVDCRRTTSCVVDCAPGAACLVDCSMGTCSFASCESAPLACPPRLACGVACP